MGFGWWVAGLSLGGACQFILLLRLSSDRIVDDGKWIGWEIGVGDGGKEIENGRGAQKDGGWRRKG